MSAEAAVEQDVTLEDVGKEILRWGLVVVVGWIGAMKFTAYEAMGIQPLVAHSPLLHWTYNFLSVRSFSTMLGFIEIGTAALIALRSVSPKASAIGSFLAIGLFLTTLSFLFSTPGWEPSLGGFPALSALPGQFLLKDIVLLGASVWSLGESLRAVEAQLFVEGGLQKMSRRVRSTQAESVVDGKDSKGLGLCHLAGTSDRRPCLDPHSARQLSEIRDHAPCLCCLLLCSPPVGLP